MNDFIRNHFGALFTIFGIILAVLGLIAAFSTNIRAVFESTWAVAWIGLVVTIVAICIAWRINDGKLQKLEATRKEHDTLLIEHEKLGKMLERREIDFGNLNRDLEAARTQVRSLQKPVPTARDRALFERLLEEWPRDGGTLFWIINTFNAKVWASDTPGQLFDFVDRGGELYFEDPLVNNTFDVFKGACADFSSWLATESSPSDHDFNLQVLHEEATRAGGYAEYESVRAFGRYLSNRVIDGWRNLEHVGRFRGL